jgi:hypothetical protein
MTTSQQYFIHAPNSVAQDIGGELIVLDMASERYLSIDKIGAQVWDSLGSGAAVQQIVGDISAKYQADQKTVEIDVHSFIESLKNLGLIVPVTP